MLKNFKPRLYQETILDTATKANTLVVLPTGMGKTSVAVMLAAHRLNLYPNSKILILAPTKPLVEQLMSVFRNILQIEHGDESREHRAVEEEIVMFTGFVSPQKRKEMWEKARIVASTPQGLQNDVISRKINLEDVSLLVFDEAHRATGDYAYTFLAKQYMKYSKYARILALTASPGSELEKITEVCENLFIEDIEIRTDEDPDVKPYIQELDISWVKVELSDELLSIKKQLEYSFKSKLDEMKKYGFARTNQPHGLSKKDILSLQAQLHAQVAQGNKDFEILKSLSLVAEAVKVHHALELVETQGIHSLHIYLDKVISQSKTSKVKAVQNLGKDVAFRTAFIKTERLYNDGIEHPKIAKLKQIVNENIEKSKKIRNEIKLIIFTQYRDSGSKILEELESVEGCTPRLFVGQQKKGETGMTQKKQIELLDDFRQGSFNTLIATSVAEEGLDIPAVDHVIFYEPIPSAIRHIQRRGRTGRLEKGKVTVLMAKNTRDEGYRWSAHHKEKRMHRTLGELKKKIATSLAPKMQSNLKDFENRIDEKTQKENENIKIFIDTREKGSNVMKELLEFGCHIDLTRMEAADYLVSSRCAIEIKTVPDFVDSIIDGRLLEQLRALKKNFERPIVIIEGTEDIYSVRKVHPNAIQGMLATIAISYSIPIIQTRNFRETASLILVMAKREQQELGKEFSPHAEKRAASIKEQQEYVISALPNIGLTHARQLLSKFGSVKNVVNASEDDLKGVDLIGEKKAKAIKDVVEKEYEE